MLVDGCLFLVFLGGLFFLVEGIGLVCDFFGGGGVGGGGGGLCVFGFVVGSLFVEFVLVVLVEEESLWICLDCGKMFGCWVVLVKY